MAKRQKIRDLKRHAKLRFSQRVGGTLDEQTLQSLITKIQNGEAELVDKQSNRVTVWRIEINNEFFNVFYDKQRKTIITFIPLTNVWDML